MIYKLALVLDHPIELWPVTRAHWWTEENVLYGMKGRQVYRDDRAKLAVGLLRVSTQINSETASIFYGMNAFHFSELFGWVVLEAFLYTIGSANRKHITDVRVCGPNIPLVKPAVKDLVNSILHDMNLRSPWYDHHVQSYHIWTDKWCTRWEELSTEHTRRTIEKCGTLKKLSLRCDSGYLSYPANRDILKVYAAKVPGLQISLMFRLAKARTWTDPQHAAYNIRWKEPVQQALQDGWKVWIEIFDDQSGTDKLFGRWEIVEDERLAVREA